MLSAKKKLNLAILIFFLAWFITASSIPKEDYLSVPSLSITQHEDASVSLTNNAILSYHMDVTFSAIGSFSVNNPITVTVNITNVNVTNVNSPNLLAYGVGIVFLNAVSYPVDGSNNEYSGVVFLNDVGNGEYQGTNQLVWLQDGQTWAVLTTGKPLVQIPYSYFTSSQPILTISGVSDTLSIIFSQNTAKIAWQLSAFSVIILQPVLEALFLKKQDTR
ncbi:MAG: hypothetical protein ABSB10_00265 [Candidatus Bathyarchaeia archaeon]|jgi:hypothetical protein